MTYQPQVHENQIKRKLTTKFSQSELKKPFRSTLLVNICRKGGAKETRAANNIGRKVSISTVALTGIRPPSSAYGNNTAVEGIISKCPLWVATMRHVFRMGALDLHTRSTTLEIKICRCTRGQKPSKLRATVAHAVKQVVPWRCDLYKPVHCTCTHGQNFPFGFLGPRNLDPRLHTGSRFSFRATTVVRPSQHVTVPSGVPFVFDEDENRENKKSLILY